ncbi:SDR family NAD(P)-dependent oxidoreductase [Paenibacillus sp. PR3]|uniref:SDR family NAD(P)-dependent oxidoreductase n=1 Tax=Paenibacillus terricola TaxID=2763503 RepID=A0ABR8MWS4_9BACL|nr:SDR family NAD(P)-dependent oxidoreductase [Paenibacillus terricola]MBD3920413.1 SDR family NAD(P)-dependent oxidoreductase [Paenibacillus terricola]
MKLSNNTILITGGTSGIGLGFAQELLKRGNNVIIVGRNQAMIDEVTKTNPGLIGLQGDVSNPESVRAIADFVRNNYPETNILFHSAGIMREFNLLDPSALFEQSTLEIETNLKGTIWLTQALLPQLSMQQEAMIVTVSSGLSFVSSPNHPVYSATKAGIHMFTDALRIQLKKSNKNIHVMELVPPLVSETKLQPSTTDNRGIPDMSVQTLVKHGMKGMERNKKRVVPGLSKYLRFGGKYFPDFVSNAMAK